MNDQREILGKIPDGCELVVECPACGVPIVLGDEFALRSKDGKSVVTCSCDKEIVLLVRQVRNLCSE